jgi:hypothetical protein
MAAVSWTNQGAKLLSDYVTAPLSATWNHFRSDYVKALTTDDLKNAVWDTAISAVPIFVGGATASIVAYQLSKLLPAKMIYGNDLKFHKNKSLAARLRPLFSIGITIVAMTAGCAAAVLAIPYLPNLAPFPGDKAVRLIAGSLVLNALIMPIRFAGSAPFVATGLVFIGTSGAVPGFFGQRSLVVLGALSAYLSAFNYGRIAQAVSRSVD